MLIQLNDTRRIVSDDHQYMVQKYKTSISKKTQEETSYWESYLYFGTINLLLKCLPDVMLRESDAQGWASCNEILKSTYRMIETGTREKSDG